jgi:hypothetical protein
LFPSNKFIKLTSDDRLSRLDSSHLAQIRMGHFPVNAYLEKIGRADSVQCPACGHAREEVRHFLLDCPSYAHKRWTGDQTDDRHSTSGYVFLLAISWSSCKQKTVAQNTTEAEYMAMTDTANQAVWYHSFLEELQYSVDEPIPLHRDNKGTIDLALNPVTGRRSKHIEIKHHAIREYVEQSIVTLVHTPTAEMLADGFTKPLACGSLQKYNTQMGLTQRIA